MKYTINPPLIFVLLILVLAVGASFLGWTTRVPPAQDNASSEYHVGDRVRSTIDGQEGVIFRTTAPLVRQVWVLYPQSLGGYDEIIYVGDQLQFLELVEEEDEADRDPALWRPQSARDHP